MASSTVIKGMLSTGLEQREPSQTKEHMAITQTTHRLYQMMRELSEALKDHPELPSDQLVRSWREFCTRAVDSFDSPVKRR
jgi:hypothetical protein